LKVLRLEVFIYNFYITNQFQTTFAQGEWEGGVKSVREVTVNSKEKNSLDFCPNHVQEFGLCTHKKMYRDIPHGCAVTLPRILGEISPKLVLTLNI
jgi:hypothetical protein